MFNPIEDTMKRLTVLYERTKDEDAKTGIRLAILTIGILADIVFRTKRHVDRDTFERIVDESHAEASRELFGDQ